MIVYQTNPTGVFLHALQADENPRRPGSYLIPAGAIETPPPEIPAGKSARWDGASWSLIDGTVDEAAAAVDLAEERAAMVLTRLQFALVCVGAEIMTADEAEAWLARGEIPGVALEAIAGLGPAEKVQARIRLAGAQTIARLEPLIALLQDQADLTDEQVDGLFRVGAGI